MTTYSFAGLMREQVCLYMCPWPRIQAALTDEYAFNVTYRYDRGEPRAIAEKGRDACANKGYRPAIASQCLQCVYVCPTGVDIRNGPNLGCIQCGLCIDACDAVMAKTGRPARLIAYDTDVNIHSSGRKISPQSTSSCGCALRLYAAVIAAVGGLMLYTRRCAEAKVSASSMTVIRSSFGSPMARSAMHSPFTSLNKALETRLFELTVEGVPDLDVILVGDTAASGNPLIVVSPDQTREIPRAVDDTCSAPPAASVPLTFTITDAKDGSKATAVDNFRGP